MNSFEKEIQATSKKRGRRSEEFILDNVDF